MLSRPCHAGHYCNRIHVTAVGCLLWGLMTASFGFCSSVSQGIFFWGMNGVGKPLYHDVPVFEHSGWQRLGFVLTSASQRQPRGGCCRPGACHTVGTKLSCRLLQRFV